MSTRDSVLLTRPKDETLDAFKEFYIELCKHMGIEIAQAQMDDEERWVKTWTAFWKKKKR